ncbi:MAG: radical SAM protein, partial [bacterium]|nr:radical SAM protein [bacterium]
RRYIKPHMRICNTIQTNGVLLDDEWCEFLHKHNFLVGLSLDGPQKHHDVYRKDKHGNPTFERVMQGARLLRKYKVDFNIMTAVHAANVRYPLEVYRYLRDEGGAQYIQFIPIVEIEKNKGGGNVQSAGVRSVGAKQYGKFLITIFDEWIRNDVGRIFVQSFDVALASWVGAPPGPCIFSPECGVA